MKTKKPFSRTTLVVAAILALLAWAVPALLLAQEPDTPPPPRVEVERECRCVDADGNEIEGCICLGRSVEGLRGQLEVLRGELPALRQALPRLRGALSSFMRRRAQIGVGIDYSQDESRGAVIQDVQGDSPAAAAGLRAGDIVTHVAGASLLEPLDDPEAEGELDEEASVTVQRFARLVGDLEPEEPAELTLLREGREVRIEVTPEPAGMALALLGGGDADAPWVGSYRFFPEDELPELDSMQVHLRRGLEPLSEMRWRFELDDDEAPRVFGFRVPGGGDADLCLQLRRDGGGPGGLAFLGGNCVAGAEFLDLNPDLGSYFGSEDGVLVAQVAEGSPLGLRAGDVILAIDGRDVRSAAHVRRILDSYEADEEIRLRILREGDEREVLGRRD